MEAGAARSQVRRRKFVKSNDPVRAPDGLPLKAGIRRRGAKAGLDDLISVKVGLGQAA